LGHRKDIHPIKTLLLIPRGSVPEQMEEEDQGEPADPDSPGNTAVKWK